MTGTASAESDELVEVARANATEASAREAFATDLGSALLEQLSAYGVVESASFDALGVNNISASPTSGTGQLTVTQARDDEAGTIAGFITELETEEFDGTLTVRLFPEGGIAGATATQNGEAVVLSPHYDGLRLQSETRSLGCTSCASWDPACGQNDCGCSYGCSRSDTDMDHSRVSHTVCDDGTVDCDNCSLGCDTGW